MYRSCDFDLQQPLPWNEQALIQDLGLNTLFRAMARDDDFLFNIAKSAVLLSLTDIDTILYRQDILKDCLKNPDVVRNIYDITVELIQEKKKNWYYSILSHYPDSIVHGAVGLMQIFVRLLKKLRHIADEHAHKFSSEGFKQFFSMLRRELDDDYLDEIQEHLRHLQFKNGVFISAELGKGNEGTNYLLCKPDDRKQGWLKHFFANRLPSYTFTIHERDEGGFRALEELRHLGLNSVANAVAQSADHVESFFKMLRVEVGFYVGCLNLHDQLTRKREPVCFPSPAPANERKHTFIGLYDVCLSLRLQQMVVGNNLSGDNKDLVIITGANQGGKSTFLRSIGLAQLMMQCGMFVPAKSYSSNIASALITHYKREEDIAMVSGKLDEELARMSEIVDHLAPNSLLLLNESFSATNEREGSEIARQITRALMEKRIKIFFVTHLYDFSSTLAQAKMKAVLFLRAERYADGARTFKIIEGEPLATSYGVDLYNEIFVEKTNRHNETDLSSDPRVAQ